MSTGEYSIVFLLLMIWIIISKFSSPLDVSICWYKKDLAGFISLSRSCSNWESRACFNAISISISASEELTFKNCSMNSLLCRSGTPLQTIFLAFAVFCSISLLWMTFCFFHSFSSSNWKDIRAYVHTDIVGQSFFVLEGVLELVDVEVLACVDEAIVGDLRSRGVRSSRLFVSLLLEWT